ncbi:hypothetical protein SNEBB_004887 [Seison nebaliae]|nr:hypothetical protein SNEBB_004887 [Seison nebaliae]
MTYSRKATETSKTVKLSKSQRRKRNKRNRQSSLAPKKRKITKMKKSVKFADGSSVSRFSDVNEINVQIIPGQKIHKIYYNDPDSSTDDNCTNHIKGNKKENNNSMKRINKKEKDVDGKKSKIVQEENKKLEKNRGGKSTQLLALKLPVTSESNKRSTINKIPNLYDRHRCSNKDPSSQPNEERQKAKEILGEFMENYIKNIFHLGMVRLECFSPSQIFFQIETGIVPFIRQLYLSEQFDEYRSRLSITICDETFQCQISKLNLNPVLMKSSVTLNSITTDELSTTSLELLNGNFCKKLYGCFNKMMNRINVHVTERAIERNNLSK